MRFDSRVLAAALALTTAWAVAAHAADEKAPADKAKEKGNPMVILSTSMGDIKVELFADKAPVTVKNFLDYVEGKLLRRHHLPPRHPELHGPGRRAHAPT